jgi:DNA-binding NarL/FixJ family response regulator
LKLISILVVDNKLSREGLLALIEKRRNGFLIVGEAASSEEALYKLETLKPNILLTDIDMPVINGIEIARQVKSISPETKVIIFSSKSDEASVLAALRAGARGYVLKTDSFESLDNAINKVSSGRYYLSEDVVEKVIGLHYQSDDKVEPLTDREKEVLSLVKEGLTNMEIARQLDISPRTAEVHRFRAMKKLDLHSQTDVMRYFMKEVTPAGTGTR